MSDDADQEPLTVDYWRLTRVLGRTLEHDSPEFWRVAEALGAEFPQYSWHNAMTDGDSADGDALTRVAPGPARYMLFAHPDYYPAGGADDRVDLGFRSVADAEEYMGVTGRLPGNDKAHLLDTVEGLIVRDWRRDSSEREVAWRALTVEEAERASDWRYRIRAARLGV